MLPQVDFCGLKVTRLIIGANPFGGFSHQSEERDREMKDYYTVDRIIETWKRAEAAGINTMITNNETQNVLVAVEKYFSCGGSLQWIAQINCKKGDDLCQSIDRTVRLGCKALYIHGALVDDAFARKDEATLRSWCDHARKSGIPAGVAGHAAEAHGWAYSRNIADFHAVCFFNCGSLHHGKGHKFRLSDMTLATECVRHIQKPCIGYKIMGAGRIDPLMAFEYAFERIKPTDVVNVGIYRGDRDNMVEENVSFVRKVLGC